MGACALGRAVASAVSSGRSEVTLVEGTNIVRRELGLPEVRVRVADPSFYFASVDEAASAKRGAPQ